MRGPWSGGRFERTLGISEVGLKPSDTGRRMHEEKFLELVGDSKAKKVETHKTKVTFSHL